MRLVLRIMFVMCVLVGFQESIRADEADQVLSRLDDAKADNTKARQQAADALRAAFDDALKSAVADKQPDVAAQLKIQKDAFSSSGALPSLPAVQHAVESYREAIHLADANLQRAFSRAVRHYSSQGNSAKALAVEHEKMALFAQLPAENSPSAPGDVVDPAEIARSLSQSKAQYRTDVDDAQQTLLAKVDAKITGATNAGDLPTVQALQAIEDTLKAGGVVPAEGVTDPAVIAAATDHRRAIQHANVRMARAFSQAIHDFTRARKIDQAEAVQTDFVNTGLSGINLTAVPADTGVSPGDTTYVLGRRLPDFLTATDRWDTRTRGIALQRRSFIRSKSGDYLDRDFTCDFWFTTESTGTYIFIGIGDGRGRASDGVPNNSLALSIVSPDDGGVVGFLRADGQIEPIGRLDAPGDYVARIQKVGNVVSLSIGDEDADGTFNPRISTTVSNASVLAPFMTAHNGHLFFGGGRFWKLRYINGKPPAVIPDAVVKSLVAG